MDACKKKRPTHFFQTPPIFLLNKLVRNHQTSGCLILLFLPISKDLKLSPFQMFDCLHIAKYFLIRSLTSHLDEQNEFTLSDYHAYTPLLLPTAMYVIHSSIAFLLCSNSKQCLRFLIFFLKIKNTTIKLLNLIVLKMSSFFY